MFTSLSRYNDIDKAEWISPDRRTIVYVRRRLIPPSAGTIPLAEHVVSAGDRLDNITARYFADPEQFWRIADANDAMRPEELLEVGRVLTIPVPKAG